jgi:uncharacterized protein (DUF3820 family)
MTYNTFPFGKYKGTHLSELPINYLTHALQSFELPQELEEDLAFYLVISLNLHEKNYVRFVNDIKKYIAEVRQEHTTKSAEKALDALEELLDYNV